MKLDPDLIDFAFIGAHATWEYEDPQNPHYCAYTPFKFAFVMLVIYWVFFPFMLCYGLCCCCCNILKYSLVSTQPQPANP